VDKERNLIWRESKKDPCYCGKARWIIDIEWKARRRLDIGMILVSFFSSFAVYRLSLAAAGGHAIWC
jgi:hypothetical protein